MNSIGICGESSSPARARLSFSGEASALRRSPKARLPTWSWFWRKATKAEGGSSPDGSPRLFPECGDTSP
jgi:hypothetical protein